jgi:succinate dehydrogenase / fumarate reductase, cytochrome b subunit
MTTSPTTTTPPPPAPSKARGEPVEPVEGFRRRVLAGRVPFLLSRLHSLTGILFGGFVLVHLLVTATLVEGYREGTAQTVFQKQIDRIHSVPFLAAATWLLIFLPILYHTIYGLWLTYGGRPNVNQYPYSKNIFYLLQRVSALLLVAFLVFHVTAMRGWWAASLKFDPSQATETTVSHLNVSWLIGWFVYPLGILAACYHLGYGFWTAAITWGLTVSAAAQRRWGFICVAVFVLSLICGMIALVAALTSAATARHL